MYVIRTKTSSRSANTIHVNTYRRNFLKNPFEFIYKRRKIDENLLLNAMSFEALYVPYIKGLDSDCVIVMNTSGVCAAKFLGKKVVVDLMDLWSCELDEMRFNAVDFKALKKADYVIA